MQLQQVNRVRFQVSQAAFDEGREVDAIVTVRGVWIEPAARLGGDVKFFLPLLSQFCHQPFAAAVAIDIRGVEEIHAAVERGVEGGERFLIVHVTPGAADGPRAKADFRNLPAGSSEFSIFHARKLNGKSFNAKTQRRGDAKIGGERLREPKGRARHSVRAGFVACERPAENCPPCLSCTGQSVLRSMKVLSSCANFSRGVAARASCPCVSIKPTFSETHGRDARATILVAASLRCVHPWLKFHAFASWHLCVKFASCNRRN